MITHGTELINPNNNSLKIHFPNKFMPQNLDYCYLK